MVSRVFLTKIGCESCFWFRGGSNFMSLWDVMTYSPHTPLPWYTHDSSVWDYCIYRGVDSFGIDRSAICMRDGEIQTATTKPPYAQRPQANHTSRRNDRSAARPLVFSPLLDSVLHAPAYANVRQKYIYHNDTVNVRCCVSYRRYTLTKE